MTALPPACENLASRNIHEQETRTMNDTAARDVAAILADIDSTQPGTWTARSLKNELEIAVRRQLAPLPEGESERMAAEAEHAARTMAPPVPGITMNAGKIVRAVITAGGRDTAWFVACEDPERGQWATWRAEMPGSGDRTGQLAYSNGRYYDSPDPAANRRAALAGLAVRAGLMPEIALLIADEVTRDQPEHGPYTPGQHADRAMASRLRKWAGR